MTIQFQQQYQQYHHPHLSHQQQQQSARAPYSICSPLTALRRLSTPSSPVQLTSAAVVSHSTGNSSPDRWAFLDGRHKNTAEQLDRLQGSGHHTFVAAKDNLVLNVLQIWKSEEGQRMSVCAVIYMTVVDGLIIGDLFMSLGRHLSTDWGEGSSHLNGEHSVCK
jgi:hypothetical protein